MNKPQIHLKDAPKKFGEEGNLINEEDKEKVAKFMESFVSWVKRFS